MASAKFLEEALNSTDVDESAVNAIVGSLETQLGNTTAVASTVTTSNTLGQNHVTAQQGTMSNGAPSSTLLKHVESTNSANSDIMYNADTNKVVTSNIQNSVGTSGVQYMNQVGAIAKTQDGVKLVYANSQLVNPRNFTGQLSALPNGTLTNATQIGKTTATAVLVKQTTNSSQATSISSSTSTTTMPGVVTLAKPLSGQQAALVGGQQILPTNVQIVNVNALRAGQPGQTLKGISQRVMIGGQMVGGRQVAPGQITLQTLPGLGSGAQGHLLLKTENGQYQLLRVGQLTTTSTGGVTGAQGNTTFRVQAIQNPTLTSTTATTAVVQQQHAQQTASLHQQQSQTVTQQTQQQTTGTAQTQSAQTTRPTDQTREKCRKFLANLLELSSREPKAVERSVRTLIQELVDAKVEPEQFCDKLEKLLNASPQPCLIGFLKKSLPLLRVSMVNKEMSIDGIRPPPASVLTTNLASVAATQSLQMRAQIPTATQMRVIAQPSTRPGQPIQHRIVTMPVASVNAAAATQLANKVIATAATVRSQVPISGNQTVSSTSSLVRGVATQFVRTPTGPTAITLRPGQTLAKMPQFANAVASISVPTTVSVAATTTTSVVSTSSASMPTLTPTQRTASTAVGSQAGNIRITTSMAATQIGNASSKTALTSHLMGKTHVEKSKPGVTYASGGTYTGDDDINDVAAMGGVNLAEETQRILGSTEFVGTQIRSCKDELFLHTIPLIAKIKKIANKYGINDSPNGEVVAMISHAAQERLKDLIEKLAVISEHRIDLNKFDPRYEITQDVRGQLKFLEEIDKAERKRHEEQEREVLLRAAKSRSKTEDPEQAKLKAKAKEMQRAEMEELRQREANVTALLAIGPRKKPKLEENSSLPDSNTFNNNNNRLPKTQRPRVKRVTARDVLHLMENEKETTRSPLLYASYLK